MRTILVASFAAITLSGCVSVNKQAMDGKAMADIKGQSVTYTTRKKPDFAAMTAGKAAFAMIGAFAMISEGNGLVASNNIADPADAIANGLAKALEAAHGIRLVTAPVSVSTDDAAQVATAAASAAGYVLDVQTINWAFAYFPTDWTHYRVMYSAKARLINTKSRAVNAEGFCQRSPESNTNAPTHEELLGNGAARLKVELDTAASECVSALKAQLMPS